MSNNQDLISDLIIEAGLIDNDAVVDLLTRAADALALADAEASEVLRAEMQNLDTLSHEGFDLAHGKGYADWEPLAKRAIRLRIAAEVLKDRLRGAL